MTTSTSPTPTARPRRQWRAAAGLFTLTVGIGIGFAAGEMTSPPAASATAAASPDSIGAVPSGRAPEQLSTGTAAVVITIDVAADSAEHLYDLLAHNDYA